LRRPIGTAPGGFVWTYEMCVKDVVVKDDALCIRQRLMVFQQNGSGEQKIAGLRKYGGELFELNVFNIDQLLPPVLDDTSAYLPKDISCELVLDFLRHNDLSTDLAALCAKKNIPVIASGKKIACKGLVTPPT
jgi:thymidylate synthase